MGFQAVRPGKPHQLGRLAQQVAGTASKGLWQSWARPTVPTKQQAYPTTCRNLSRSHLWSVLFQMHPGHVAEPVAGVACRRLSRSQIWSERHPGHVAEQVAGLASKGLWQSWARPTEPTKQQSYPTTCRNLSRSHLWSVLFQMHPGHVAEPVAGVACRSLSGSQIWSEWHPGHVAEQVAGLASKGLWQSWARPTVPTKQQSYPTTCRNLSRSHLWSVLFPDASWTCRRTSCRCCMQKPFRVSNLVRVASWTCRRTSCRTCLQRSLTVLSSTDCTYKTTILSNYMQEPFKVSPLVGTVPDASWTCRRTSCKNCPQRSFTNFVSRC